MTTHFFQRKRNSNWIVFDFPNLWIRWKIAGNIPGVELRLSDKRLFYIINHVQSIPFPETKQSTNDIPALEAEVGVEFVDESEEIEVFSI